MNLEVLSSRESVSLCRAAAVLALGRFRGLAQRVDPGDRPLNRLFSDLNSDGERNLVEILELEGPGWVAEPAEEQMGQNAARGFLPSLTISSGAGPLDRKAGVNLVECLLEDLGRFYGAMVRQTCDDKTRVLLARSKLIVTARLDDLHRGTL